MLGWLRRPDPLRGIAQQLYGSSVAQARQADFYARLGVADSLAGRFEMVVLHVVLVLERLKGEGEAGRRLGQRLMETMFEALDDDMREMGVGDLSVPKKIHKAAGAFLGRMKAYSEALAETDGASLEAAIGRNLGTGEGPGPDCPRLAAYLRAAMTGLKGQAAAGLLAGTVRFPAPQEVAP